MYTFHFMDGVLTILKDGVITHYQPANPNTQEPWADAAAAEDWAKETIKGMQGVLSRKITTLAFVRRFNLPEHAAIKAMMETDSYVAAIYDRLMMAKFIDLEDTDVENGMMYYVSKGLITEERLVEILTSPVTQIEQP